MNESEVPSPGALASVPAAGSRRALPMPSHLKFFYGPMDCGKSTLALQIDHNHARQGRHGMLLTRYDRSGGAAITTRVGLAHDAVEVTDDTDIRLLVRAGDTVVVADTDAQAAVRYQVLCRAHYRHGDLGPRTADDGQLSLDV